MSYRTSARQSCAQRAVSAGLLPERSVSVKETRNEDDSS